MWCRQRSEYQADQTAPPHCGYQHPHSCGQPPVPAHYPSETFPRPAHSEQQQPAPPPALPAKGRQDRGKRREQRQVSQPASAAVGKTTKQGRAGREEGRGHPSSGQAEQEKKQQQQQPECVDCAQANGNPANMQVTVRCIAGIV